ncbi:MAG: SAM-dependent methyltransferase [Acidimicrobiales bacterium]|jgi:SAM-dependent methyltransferase
MPSAFVPASPFRSIVPIRRLPIEPAVDLTRERFEQEYGEDPEDRGGWLHQDDWYRLTFALNAIRRGGRFLDVGLGAGQFINAVAATGWFSEVHGSDPTRFNKYQEFVPNIQRIDASVAELPYPDDHFDVVTCMEVLEHVPDEIFEASFSELRRVCRGQLLMSVPYEEPEPIYSSHRRRFEAEDIWRVFPESERVLLKRPRTPWALMEEWCGPGQAPMSALRLGAVEAVLAAGPAPSQLRQMLPRPAAAPIEAAAPASGRVRSMLNKLRS